MKENQTATIAADEKDKKVIPVTETIQEPTKEVVTDEVKEIKPFVPPYNSATDLKKSHKERIVAFLESRNTGEFIKLNDFLKSLFGLPTPGIAPLYTNQSIMKKLKSDLLELEAGGFVVFKDEHFKRLGKHHFPDQNTGKTHYYDITNIPIEAKIA